MVIFCRINTYFELCSLPMTFLYSNIAHLSDVTFYFAGFNIWQQLQERRSVLWSCWLGVRKSIGPVKDWVMRCWCGYLSGARCKWYAYGPADNHCHPSPLVHYNPDWFRKEAVKWMTVNSYKEESLNTF